MPSQNGPNPKVFELIAAKGGSVWPTVTNVVAGGAALAALVFEQPYAPDDAKTLLGIRPIDHITDGAAAESVLAVFSLEGANYGWQPQEVICGTVADSILLTSNALLAHSEYYDVFAPIPGGAQFNAVVEPCDAIAGNRRSAMEFLWTDVRLPLPVIYSQCSREVALGAAAGIAAGTTFNLSHTHEAIEIGGVHTHAAITVEEELTTTLIVRCTNFKKHQELAILFEPTGLVQDEAVDEGAPCAYVARRMVREKFASTTSVVTNNLDVDVLLSAAGQAVHYIRYT